MTRLDKLVVALLFAVIFVTAFNKRPPADDPMAGRRPLPPSAEVAPSAPETRRQRVRRPLPARPSANDPEFFVESPEEFPKGTLGTAFSINDRGIWMTARHVTVDCAQIGLLPWGGTVSRASVTYTHPSADLSVIASNHGAQAVAFSDAQLQEGQAGISLGFPSGVPGAAYLQVLGRSRLKSSGRMVTASPAIIWAEAARFPDSLETLGGMSGGPVVDQQGNVIGVLVASSKRRGRAFSIAPEVLKEARRDLVAGAKPRPLAEVRQGPDRLPQIAEAATRGARIAKVYCRRN